MDQIPAELLLKDIQPCRRSPCMGTHPSLSLTEMDVEAVVVIQTYKERGNPASGTEPFRISVRIPLCSECRSRIIG